MTLDLLRHFVLKHKLGLSIFIGMATLGFFVLAVTAPRTATPVGIGYIAVVLLIIACIRLFEGERRRGQP